MGRTGKLWVGILCAAVGTIVLVQSASAVPPPPRFYDFRVRNTTGVDVEKISIELHTASAATAYATLDPEPMIITVSKLANGKELTIGSGSGDAGMYGIAKIVVRAECPGGQSLQMPAEIVAEKGPYDPATTHEEYGGFCEDAPPGQVDYAPNVVFRATPAGGFEAVLSARSRWGLAWSPVISDPKPFGP